MRVKIALLKISCSAKYSMKKVLYLRAWAEYSLNIFNGNYTLGRISDIFTRKTNFVTFWLLSCTLIPFWKEIFSKRKELASSGSQFFTYRVDPFFRKRKRIFSPESESVPLNLQHSCYRSFQTRVPCKNCSITMTFPGYLSFSCRD